MSTVIAAAVSDWTAKKEAGLVEGVAEEEKEEEENIYAVKQDSGVSLWLLHTLSVERNLSLL